MSIHVCKCEHNGRTEYHLRYPGMTQDEAQALADRINGGELVGAEHPARKDADRWRWLRDEEGAHAIFSALYFNTQTPEQLDAEVDAAIERTRAVG